MTDPFREHLQQALADSYTFERELTGGGMSRVFMAREHALGRTVVVKVLPPELAAGVNRERFRREIQLAAGLHHPHIVPLLNAGEMGDVLYYTMPYIEGESLRAALDRRGAIPTREVLRILHDVVDALAYAHARGIVHRDIKPGNVLLTGNPVEGGTATGRWHALVTDFGVAKALSAALPMAGMTTSGMAIGTPAYMAPEQLAGDPAADHRVDIYATGLLAYELLTGSSPFQGESPQATMAAQLTRIPEPLDRCCPEVPAAVSAVIMRCLAKLPEERPQTAQTLLEALESASVASGETAARPAMVPDATRAAPPARRRWPLFAAAAALVMGAVGIAAALVIRDMQQSRTIAGLTAEAERARADSSNPGSVAAIADDTAGSSAPIPPPSAAPGTRASRDSAAPGAARGVLTRADSLAIAAAVQREIARREQGRSSALSAPAPEPGDPRRMYVDQGYVDSLTRSLESLRRLRGMNVPLNFDSAVEHSIREATRQAAGVGRVMIVPPAAPTPGVPRVGRRGASVGAARRVAIVPLAGGTGVRELDDAAPAITDSLRSALAAIGGYEVLDAGGSLDDPNAVAARTGAGAVVFGTLLRRGDQLVIQLLLHDSARGYPLGGTLTFGTPPDRPLAVVPAMARRLMMHLDGVAWERSGVSPPLPPRSP